MWEAAVAAAVLVAVLVWREWDLKKEAAHRALVAREDREWRAKWNEMMEEYEVAKVKWLREGGGPMPLFPIFKAKDQA